MSDEQRELPPVFIRYYALMGWLLDRVEKFPKNARFTFGDRIANHALDVVEYLVRARYSRRRKESLEAANTKLEVLRIMMRLAKDRHFISIAQYEYAMTELLEVGRMVGGWLRADPSCP